LPFAFTERGRLMAAKVLKSPRATAMTVETATPVGLRRYYRFDAASVSGMGSGPAVGSV
jgi:hypothetical protein